MRNTILGALVGLGLGVVGVLFLRPDPESPQKTAPAAEPASVVRPNAEPRLTGSRGADEAILGRLASVEAEVSRLADAVAAFSRGATGGASSSPKPEAPEGGADAALSAETIRARWSEALDKVDESLRTFEAQGDSGPVIESHKDDLRRARAALAAARSLVDLKQLAAGRWKKVFKLP